MKRRGVEPDQQDRKRRVQVGMSQLIRLDWLERTGNFVLAGNKKLSIFEALTDLLRDKVSVGRDADRGNREKIITILMKVWLNVPRGLEAFRIEGLQLLRSSPSNLRLAIHWGMVMAVYPFWGSVASQVGRLLKLQSSLTISQIQRRLREQYGERETVYQAGRRAIRSFVDWGVLRKAEAKGVYEQGHVIKVGGPQLVAWLIEAQLYSYPERKANMRLLLDSPSLFPVNISAVSIGRIGECSARLEVTKVDMDDSLVILHHSDVRQML